MRAFWVFVLVTFSAMGQVSPEAELVFNVPRVNGVMIDGDAADWGSKGFHVDVMASVDGSALSPADFDPAFRLAWDERGLLILVQVRDDAALESADETTYAQKDSVEILAAAAVGAEDLVHVTIAPGMSGESPDLKVKSFDWRKREPREPVAVEAARMKSGNGYAMEILLPWKNLAITPKAGLETALQVQVNDADGDEGTFRAAWYPSTPPAGRTNAMYRIRLANRASAPVRTIARAQYDELAQTMVRVVAANDWTGKTVSVRDGGESLAETALVDIDGRGRAELKFAMPPVGETYESLQLRVGRAKAGEVSLPDARVWRAQKLMTYAPKFKPPVFSTSGFPACDYDNPLLAERLLGPYGIERTFYDAKFNKVTTPDAPGRYGAVIDVIPQTGAPLRRYATLYKQAESFNVFAWWFLKPEATVTLPPKLGIDHGALDAQESSLGLFMQWQFQDALMDDKDSAVLLAGLAETPADSAKRDVYDDVFALDRQWWVTLKRKLNGSEAAYPNAFVCPYQKEGAPATMLRVGTADEAGIKPESLDALDALLKTWVEESKEPFAVCLARHGVIYFERAYGERFGAPMTVETKSWMASISKFLSGGAMMTLVDQGLVDLDKPIDAYLPSLRGIDVKTPLTVRHCFTHTNGLQLGIVPPRMFNDHYGDEMNDYEEVIAGYYPYLEVGTRHGYNGCGYAVAGKVIEQITGEALPQFFETHMWGPLGCTNTDEFDMSARTRSIPRDIATFGQMMLNKGAYGNMRFFSEATFEKMMPVKLAPYVSFPAGDLEWGIGPLRNPEQGLSPKTFGHGAASAATFKIDPENDLVIVMTRDSAGPKFGEYHPQFIKAVVEGLK